MGPNVSADAESPRVYFNDPVIEFPTRPNPYSVFPEFFTPLDLTVVIHKKILTQPCPARPDLTRPDPTSPTGRPDHDGLD